MSNSATTQNISFDPILTCQPNHILYPARLALSTARLKQTSQSDTALKLPVGMPQPGDDYELRSLRSGYIYLLSLAVADEETMSAKGEDGLHAWYIYHYSSEDIPNKDGGLDYRFQQYRYDELDLRRPRQRIGLAEYYLRLPQYVNKIDIMYSDMELAPELLDELVKNPTARRHWMRNVTLDTSEGPVEKVDRLNRFRASVKDLSEDAKPVSQEPSNIMRSAFIGHRTQFDTLINQVGNCSNIHVVALEDPVGTARDLADYHYALFKERQQILKKYEYAMVTAQIIHSHVVQIHLKQKENFEAALRNGTAAFHSLPPTPLSELYRELDIHADHLSSKNDDDIFNILASDLQLELNNIKCLNTVHKMATIPMLYGNPFKHLVNVFTALINSNDVKNRLDSLSQLLLETPDIHLAENWCLWMHGLLFGLDISPYGRNAITAALSESPDSFPFPPQTQKDAGAIAALTYIGKNMGAVVDTLASLASSERFSIGAYDLFVDVIVDKVYIKDFRGKQAKTLTQEKLRKVYEIHPFTKEVRLVDTYKMQPMNRSVPNQSRKISERFRLDNANRYEVRHSNYATYQVTENLSGLSKALGFAYIFNLFSGENRAKTVEGQLANDPVLGVMIMFANQYMMSPSELERFVQQTLVDMPDNLKFDKHKNVVDFVQDKVGHEFDSRFTRLKRMVMSANTLLAGLGALMQYGYWKEAQYKGDYVVMNAAILQGVGGITLEASIGALGLMAEGQRTLWISRLMTLARAGTWIGASMLLVGIALSFFETENIKIWIKNGYWGNSKSYWGNPTHGYEWIGKTREGKFIDQFKKSQFNYHNQQIEPAEIVNYYQIEMQRYFQIETPIQLSVIDKHRILVAHPSLTSEQIASQIQVKEIDLFTLYGLFPSPSRPSRIEFDPNIPGQAVLHFPAQWQVTSRNTDKKGVPEILTFPDEHVYQLKIKVSIPDYQGSDKSFSSELVHLKF